MCQKVMSLDLNTDFSCKCIICRSTANKTYESMIFHLNKQNKQEKYFPVLNFHLFNMQ